jgi:hypothetical protein
MYHVLCNLAEKRHGIALLDRLRWLRSVGTTCRETDRMATLSDPTSPSMSRLPRSRWPHLARSSAPLPPQRLERQPLLARSTA